MLAEYVTLVRELYKANGNEQPPGYIRAVHGLQDEYEAKALKSLQTMLKRLRQRLLPKLKPVLFEELYKADTDEVRKKLADMIQAALGDYSSALVAELEPLIDALAKEFASAYQVKLNFRLVNEKAVDYLRNHAMNYFSTFGDDQAQGIMATIADKMADTEARYSLKDIVGAIRASIGKDTLYFATAQGPRAMDATAWAATTARTETARAASFAQRANLESLDLRTSQWLVQETGCEICSQNDNEIVALGDVFPSGDSEPPAHPNCRCLITAVMDELDSID